MQTLKLSFWAAILAVTAAPAFAADLWTGTWKEDPSKLKVSGVVSYTAKGAGFHFSNGTTIQYDFACDGKVYPSYSNVSIKCTMGADGSIDWSNMHDGKVTATQHRTFSADGKTMTMNETDYNNDGTTTKAVLLRTRKSGTTGLAGEWADTRATESEPDVVTFSAKGDAYHIAYPHSASTLDIKFDGTEAKPMGKGIPPGVTVSYKLISPSKLTLVSKLNGKVMEEGSMTISPDGKTLTDERWLPGKETQKSSSVYIKQ